MNLGLSSSFEELKPVCDSISTKPSEENINRLKYLCDTLPDHVIQILHEYVLFPLFSSLITNEIR